MLGLGLGRKYGDLAMYQGPADQIANDTEQEVTASGGLVTCLLGLDKAHCHLYTGNTN